jgi:1-aminocyclopropane-1-carboxylate deaminase
MGDYLQQQILPNELAALFIPEGGRYQAAEVGVQLLGGEIAQWARAQGFADLRVALPSGTGTTALFLQKYFCRQGLGFEVLTCACVGGDDYLRAQFDALVGERAWHPQIMVLAKKAHFGQLKLAHYQIWQQLQRQTRVTFELLYDPQGWISLLHYLQTPDAAAVDVPVLYIHQGGVLGNESMLPRYRRKWPECVV